MFIAPASSSSPADFLPRSNEPSPPASPLNSGKRPREEEIRPIFDIEALALNIFLVLQDITGDHRERKAARMLADDSLHLLEQLGNYRPSQVQEFAREYLKKSEYEPEMRKAISLTLNSLCCISLLRSKYNGVVSKLDGDITVYLEKSEKKYLNGLIDAAKEILETQPLNQWEALQKYASTVRELAAEIEAVLSLYYYAGEESQECIYTVIQGSRIGTTNLYPNCAKHFKLLCQNLQSAGNEQQDLMKFRSAAQAKIFQLDQDIKPFFQALDLKESSPTFSERESFFIANEVVLWETGPFFLKKVFLDTLPRGRVRGVCALPEDLRQALNNAAEKNPEWQCYDYSSLYPRRRAVPPFPDFELEFVADVWAFYSDDIGHLADFGDFMKLFIHSLPERSFQKLKTVKAAEGKARAFSDAFKIFFGNSVTFPELKRWCSRPSQIVK